MRLSREEFLRDLRQVKPWAIISSYRPQFSELENKARSANLLADLVTLDNGYYRDSVFDQDGWWDGVKEESYLVFGMPKDQALALGRKYEQDSVLHSEDVKSIYEYIPPFGYPEDDPLDFDSYSITYLSPDETITWVAELKGDFA